jgi:hypothetical protein
LGATAVVGVASASAAKVPGENILGMGSSLQGEAQTHQGANGVLSSGQPCSASGWRGWVAVWRCTAADHATLSNNPTAFYTVESSGIGLAEWGNAASGKCTSTTGVLSPACDPNGSALSELDAFIGTDDPPNSTQLAAASTAAGAGVKEVTVPVSQAPVAILLSLPTGITLNSAGTVKLSTKEVAQIYSASIPHQAACTGSTGNTWCDLLAETGLSRVTTGTPTASQFKDTTANLGGPITLQARSSGSGTTFSLRGFLFELGAYKLTTAYPYTLVTDGPSDWPVTVTETGNTSGSQLVADTTATPGSVGYANLADAALASPAYTKTPVTTAGGNQILYALVQDNFGSSKPAFYAAPSNSPGTVNLYKGLHIAINPTTCAAPDSARAVGCWVVPSAATGPWSSTNAALPGTIPSDADVADHGATANTPDTNYPIVAATYDLFWTDYDNPSSNLDTKGFYHDASCPSGTNCNTDAGNAAVSFATYLVGTGQTNLDSAGVFYGALPTAIITKAKVSAKSITP